MRNDADANDKGWFQRQKDKISDKRERRAKRKEEERKQRAEQERQIRVCRAPRRPSAARLAVQARRRWAFIMEHRLILDSQAQVEEYRKKRAELMRGQMGAQSMYLSPSLVTSFAFEAVSRTYPSF